MMWPKWIRGPIAIDLERELDEAFTYMIHEMWSSATVVYSWHPAFDIGETNDEYILTADLPGVDRDQLEVRVRPHRILVCGGRETARRAGGVRQLHLERSDGRFCRAFEMENAMDSESAETDLRDGVLEIRVKKRSLDD